MDGGKPLIFLKPYTKTLTKLKEVLEESSEQQGTEIYEIEDLQEAIQLVPQIGQALVIAAHPRKTAMLLQASRQHIKKNQTKVLLITPKPITRKTVDKFMKVGLTECIVEPIAPKTLQYKVNLLIRSISIKKEETNFEKKFDHDVATNQSDLEIKEMQRQQQEALDAVAKDANKRAESEEDFGDLYGKKKSTYQEDAIEGFYKGRNKKNQTALEDDEEDSKPQQSGEVIEGYYKGKLTHGDEHEADSDKKGKSQLDVEDDDIKELAKKVNLTFDDDDVPAKKNEYIEEEIDYQSKKKTELAIDDDEQRHLAKELKQDDENIDDIASHHLELIDDLSDAKTEKAEAAATSVTDKKKTQLDVLEDQPLRDKNKSNIEPETSDSSLKEKIKLKVEADELEELNALKQSLEEPNEKKKTATTLDIEDQSVTKEAKSREEKEENKDRKKATTLDIEDEQKAKQQDANKSKEASEKESKNKVQLILEEEKAPLSKHDKDESDNQAYSLKKKTELNIDDEPNHDYGAKKRKAKEAREREEAKAQLEIEDDSKKKAREAYQEKEFNNRSAGFTENIQERTGSKADAHADQIKTHYDSRLGLKHDDDNWQAMEREHAHDDQWKRSKTNEFVMPEKAAFGEQTIDYSDLKKQFDAIEYDLGKKKKVGEFDEAAAHVKPLGFAQAVTGEAQTETPAEDEQEEQVEENFEGPIHEASLKSSATLIRSLRLYLTPQFERDIILKQILELLRDDLGVVAAIKYGKGPRDGKIKAETLEGWLDEETKTSLLGQRQNSKDCPILPTYSDKTYEKKKTTFFFPYTEGIATFAWAECYLPSGATEDQLRSIEAVLESARGCLLDEFHELGGTGPYAQVKKKNDSDNNKSTKGFFGRLFGRKKAG